MDGVKMLLYEGIGVSGSESSWVMRNWKKKHKHHQKNYINVSFILQNLLPFLSHFIPPSFLHKCHGNVTATFFFTLLSSRVFQYFLILRERSKIVDSSRGEAQASHFGELRCRLWHEKTKWKSRIEGKKWEENCEKFFLFVDFHICTLPLPVQIPFHSFLLTTIVDVFVSCRPVLHPATENNGNSKTCERARE